MTQEEIKAFFRFLKEIDVYNAYIRNLRREGWQRNITPTARLAQMTNICPIDDSFIWSNTPQGHGFWDYINCFYLDWPYEILESKTHKYLNNFNRGHLLKQLK